jgi:signal transduction histidine kinase
MQPPGPDRYQPRLRLRDHLWRLLLSLGVSAAVWAAVAPAEWQQARWLFWTDLGFGVASFVLLFHRRRRPLAVALLVGAFGALSGSATGPGIVVAASLATRRIAWQVLLVGAAGWLSGQVFWLVQPPSARDAWWLASAGSLAGITVTLLCGMYVGSRRELLWTLRDRADRAEAERELRFSQGRANERARIAREMHDVLAHRISLVSMHAGALAYRTDLTPEQIRTTAELIQVKSHEALTDLRQVLGVLRGDDGGVVEAGQRPQPTFADLGALIAEAEQAGMRVRYEDRVSSADALPDATGRTIYRIVQEGLTNARKHAPGATVTVLVSGGPDAGLEIRIRNPAPPLVVPGPPGSGLGLVGLAERAKLAGGRLDTSEDAGAFELRGWLPWGS